MEINLRIHACMQGRIALNSIRIPSDKVVEGIREVVSNAYRYIRDSRLLLKDGSVEHAVVCAIFAAEELAKASMLSKQLGEHEGESFIEVTGFYSHASKLQEAKRLLGDALIIDSSRLGRARFPIRLGVADLEISHPIRLLCAFVDFENGEWKIGTDYNLGMLEFDLLRGIEEKLSDIKAKHSL